MRITDILIGIGGILALIAAICMPIFLVPKPPIPDKQLQHQYFIGCLEKAPAGPQSTQYNDWNEVVAECGVQARILALREVK